MVTIPYISYSTAITLTAGMGLIGLLIALVQGWYSSRNGEKVRYEKVLIIFSEIIVMSSLLYLFAVGSTHLFVVAGHALLAIMVPVESMYRITHGYEVRILDTSMNTVVGNFFNSIAQTLIGTGVIMVWMDGLYPVTLTIVYLIYLIVIAYTGKISHVWSMLERFFKY